MTGPTWNSTVTSILEHLSKDGDPMLSIVEELKEGNHTWVRGSHFQLERTSANGVKHWVRKEPDT